jgi:hypothetical protein
VVAVAALVLGDHIPHAVDFDVLAEQALSV